MIIRGKNNGRGALEDVLESIPLMYLIFDSYGTLLEMDDFYGRLQRNFAQFGAHFPPDVIKRAAHAEMRHYMKGARLANCLGSWNNLRRDCALILENAIREQGHSIELAPEQVMEILSDSVVYQPFPGVKATLSDLKKRGLRLGVLSNWDFKLKHALEDAEILPFFDFALSSAQVGVEKPAREFFEKGFALARRFQPNLGRKECFYIGDHYEKDVLGARQAGLSPLWLVRDARDIASGEIHEAERDDVPKLKSLRDLLRLFPNSLQNR
ncbi:haloacid dehalogenase superfamily, subfamily IA [Abditibacterium utsteinense]|uniref:Haloacid dehalogenase superfamily, subfamily IA n=1 Tax=Abditibacterium utsteinense TaxID=1960156 RepID=A0A2S8SRB9_9BACT|nr:HAD-IA family hydrolase [Abditibacterium utsteinense]PQV63362.1 haloacid dehalogenase superfamily, subfamily IA [Abditibacterium utsteinense]